MELFWATVGLFLFSSGLQTGLIFLQQSSGQLSKWWGPNSFAVYNVITLAPWMAVLVLYSLLQFTQHPALPWEGRWLQVIGGFLIVIGTSLALWVSVLFGPSRLNGVRFFRPASVKGRVVHGPFRWLENPMYSGYFLLLLGIALLKNSLYDLAIALESLILLNGIQARLENRGLKSVARPSSN